MLQINENDLSSLFWIRKQNVLILYVILLEKLWKLMQRSKKVDSLSFTPYN